MVAHLSSCITLRVEPAVRGNLISKKFKEKDHLMPLLGVLFMSVELCFYKQHIVLVIFCFVILV